jgi:hypothetical protein
MYIHVNNKPNERKKMNNSNENTTNGLIDGEQSTWSYNQRKYYREAPVALRGLIAKHFNG